MEGVDGSPCRDRPPPQHPRPAGRDPSRPGSGAGVNAAGPVWADRVLVAVAGLPGGAAATDEQVLEEVAVRFADRFGPTDREFADLAGRPRWHDEVIGALAAL